MPEEKTEIVLGLIEDHPEHRLVLPEQDGQKANLSNVDLSKEALDKRKHQVRFGKLFWWHTDGGADLTSANLQSANLSKANFQGAHLANANLNNSNLLFANLQNSFLRQANFQGAFLNYASFVGAYLSGADLQNSKALSVNFQNADLRGTKLQGIDLTDSNLENANLNTTDLRGVNLQMANLRNAHFSYANLAGTHLENTLIQNVDFSTVNDMSSVYLVGAWLDRTRIRRDNLGTAIGEERDRNFIYAKRAYLALKQNFDELGDYDAASWAYRKERRMEKLEALQKKQFFKFISDSIVEWLCDYGESIWRVIGWMAILLFVVEPLTLSLLGGFGWDSSVAGQYFALSSSWNKFWFSYWLHILYSLGGVGASGFSGFQPANVAVNLASSLFSLIDIFLVGLLGFVAGNRIRRS